MFNWLLAHTPLLYFTQSLWRDEAFSVLVAQKPIQFLFTKLTFEPPVYYLLLHFWMKIFGSSEIAIRSLSLLGFTLATCVVIVWAEKLFKKHFLSWVLPLFFFLNPMLLYYAFEVRTYAWFTFFTTMYMYMEKKWTGFAVASVLGFYTHTYFIFVSVVTGLHYLITLKKRKKFFSQQPTKSFIAIFLLIAPWLIKIAMEMGRLKSSWYSPVDFHLVKSVLGNMFIGYEGTPWYLWNYTAILSVILVSLFLLARNLFFILMATVPLAIVLGVSLFKPLFVNRYLIPVTVAEVFLVALAIARIKPKIFQIAITSLFLLALLLFNSWYPKEHQKLNIRATIMEVNTLMDQDDVILAQSPLIFFESIYYSKDPSRVFLYNPDNSPFPWYVGDAIVSQSQITRDLPSYPIRAYLIYENGSYDMAYQTTTVLATRQP